MFANKLCEQTSLHTSKRELHDITDYILPEARDFRRMRCLSAILSLFLWPYCAFSYKTRLLQLDQ